MPNYEIATASVGLELDDSKFISAIDALKRSVGNIKIGVDIDRSGLDNFIRNLPTVPTIKAKVELDKSALENITATIPTIKANIEVDKSALENITATIPTIKANIEVDKSALESIKADIPTLESIKTDVQVDTIALKDIKIPELPDIEAKVNLDNSALENIKVPELPNLNTSVSVDTSALENIKVPELPNIDTNVSVDTSALENIEIPKIPELNTNVNVDTSALNEIKIPKLPELNTKVNVDTSALDSINVNKIPNANIGVNIDDKPIAELKNKIAKVPAIKIPVKVDNSFSKSFQKIATNMNQIGREAEKLNRVLLFGSIGYATIAIKKFFDTFKNTDIAQKFTKTYASIQSSLARIGGLILNSSIFGKSLYDWFKKIDNILKSVTQEGVQKFIDGLSKAVILLTTISLLAKGIKFSNDIGKLVSTLSDTLSALTKIGSQKAGSKALDVAGSIAGSTAGITVAGAVTGKVAATGIQKTAELALNKQTAAATGTMLLLQKSFSDTLAGINSKVKKLTDGTEKAIDATVTTLSSDPIDATVTTLGNVEIDSKPRISMIPADLSRGAGAGAAGAGATGAVTASTILAALNKKILDGLRILKVNAGNIGIAIISIAVTFESFKRIIKDMPAFVSELKNTFSDLLKSIPIPDWLKDFPKAFNEFVKDMEVINPKIMSVLKGIVESVSHFYYGFTKFGLFLNTLIDVLSDLGAVGLTAIGTSFAYLWKVLSGDWEGSFKEVNIGLESMLINLKNFWDRVSGKPLGGIKTEAGLTPKRKEEIQKESIQKVNDRTLNRAAEDKDLASKFTASPFTYEEFKSFKEPVIKFYEKIIENIKDVKKVNDDSIEKINKIVDSFSDQINDINEEQNRNMQDKLDYAKNFMDDQKAIVEKTKDIEDNKRRNVTGQTMGVADIANKFTTENVDINKMNKDNAKEAKKLAEEQNKLLEEQKKFNSLNEERNARYDEKRNVLIKQQADLLQKTEEYQKKNLEYLKAIKETGANLLLAIKPVS